MQCIHNAQHTPCMHCIFVFFVEFLVSNYDDDEYDDDDDDDDDE